MIYFLLAAPAFLLVRLDIPPVAQLLRGMFNGYFLTLAIAGVIGTIAGCRGWSPGFSHWLWLDRGFRGLVAPLVFAADGCPA